MTSTSELLEKFEGSILAGDDPTYAYGFSETYAEYMYDRGDDLSIRVGETNTIYLTKLAKMVFAATLPRDEKLSQDERAAIVYGTAAIVDEVPGASGANLVTESLAAFEHFYHEQDKRGAVFACFGKRRFSLDYMAEARAKQLRIDEGSSLPVKSRRIVKRQRADVVAKQSNSYISPLARLGITDIYPEPLLFNEIVAT